MHSKSHDEENRTYFCNKFDEFFLEFGFDFSQNSVAMSSCCLHNKTDHLLKKLLLSEFILGVPNTFLLFKISVEYVGSDMKLNSPL